MRRFLYVATEDWFFVSHFLPMAKVAKDLGYDVLVATRVSDHGDAIRRAGLRVIPINFERGRVGPLIALRQILLLLRVMRREKPTIVHCIALRSIIVGGIALRIAKHSRVVLAVTGLGHLWVSRTATAALARIGIKWLIRRFRDKQTVVLFENRDDPAALGFAPGDARVAYVPGAGVDPERFPVQAEPNPDPIRAALVARMLWAKGIGTAVGAVRFLRNEGVDIVLDLYGEPDPDNRGAIPERQLRAWNEEAGIVWHGATNDVPRIWASAHIALLPSHYREGLPRSLVEAMASGRPVITTCVPGCRELVRDGVDGLVVPKEDPDALADALKRLATDSALRKSLGVAASRRVREGYTTAVVGERIAELYRGLSS